LARAAARSICAGPALAAESLGSRVGKTGGGLDEAGIAGFAPNLGTTGLEPTGVGLGLLVKGGGTLFVDSLVTGLEGGFFQGVEVPLAGAIPGKTETGFAEAFDVTEVGTIFGAGGVLRGGADGGGGGTDCGGTSSR